MERNGSWLRVMVLACLVAASGARELKVRSKAHKAVYNHTLAAILAEYASAVYMSDLTELFSWTCPRCDGKTKGFEVIELIVDVQQCLQAYVGVAKDLNFMVIAFRGTQEHSIQNWVEDLSCNQLDINYPGMPGAMVHHGFYYAYHNTTIRPGILDAVIRAKDLYGDINVMVTGHSMGGAMASFCGLDLVTSMCLICLDNRGHFIFRSIMKHSGFNLLDNLVLAMQHLHLTTVIACQMQYILLIDMTLCLICLHTILDSHN